MINSSTYKIFNITLYWFLFFIKDTIFLLTVLYISQKEIFEKALILFISCT